MFFAAAVHPVPIVTLELSSTDIYVGDRVEKRDDLKYLNKLSFEQGYFII